MSGLLSATSDYKKERIKKLTQEGLTTAIIAERLNMSKEQVYYYQVKFGLRVSKKNERKNSSSD